ncbi:hypothetical protein ING2E5A_0027 [Petrimonas mucosa]|uniref:Uncharacterized protein n=1 Tax=Petrimonas mucosa TaxID=1642646 RepID=A0A1G4G2Z1_9BACT|nr:hypothetical protein ING2E5A_0027 [Petrimonas mucosa]
MNRSTDRYKELIILNSCRRGGDKFLLIIETLK